MAIEDKILEARGLLKKVGSYNRIVQEDNLGKSTVTDLKGNAKKVCDEIKAKVDEIKGEIDQWS